MWSRDFISNELGLKQKYFKEWLLALTLTIGAYKRFGVVGSLRLAWCKGVVDPKSQHQAFPGP